MQRNLHSAGSPRGFLSTPAGASTATGNNKWHKNKNTASVDGVHVIRCYLFVKRDTYLLYVSEYACVWLRMLRWCVRYYRVIVVWRRRWKFFFFFYQPTTLKVCDLTAVDVFRALRTRQNGTSAQIVDQSRVQLVQVTSTASVWGNARIRLSNECVKRNDLNYLFET